MRRSAELIAWAAAALVAILALPWIFPRAFPYFPRGWETNKAEAVAIALEQMRDLGELPDDPYVVAWLSAPEITERQLQLSGRPPEEILRGRVAKDRIFWNVQVFAPGAHPSEPSFEARVTVYGELRRLRRHVPEGEGQGHIAVEEARARAEELLRTHGFDLSHYREPEARSQQLGNRTDVTLRFRDREALLGKDIDYGMAVTFAGDQLTGFDSYLDDPNDQELQQTLQPVSLVEQFWIFLAIPLLPILAIFFVRRYHAGEIGVRRGTEILAIMVACGLVAVLMCARSMSAGFALGLLSRQQVTAVVSFQILLLFFVPVAVLGFVSWSVGEAWCREARGRVLAAFDAFFKGDWQNATFARASLVGWTAGIVLTAVNWLSYEFLASQGAWVSTSALFGPWWEDVRFFLLPFLALTVALSLYIELFGRLFLVSGLSAWLGPWAGRAVAVVLGGVLLFPPVIVLPLGWAVPFWWLHAAVMVFLFLRYGIFSALLASVTLSVVHSMGPLLTAADHEIQVQAALALVVPMVPVLLSFRYLGSAREFIYRWEDVPPHVRRIAERERQRVELETARGIQSSILPDLPPRLNGVDLAHAYLPATEVGGDFYDVLALEDGRLAVAVGDVAGHGVSSGLVMSMAKSALAVQVTFDPEVASVFRTLNRTVYQTARRRLLTTLCYALLDPKRRELVYASAGHLFPYLLTRGGKVQALESVAYPLGVRGDLEVTARMARLESGDTLFLCSDGVIEARAEGSDDLFGFERLEESLRRHAGESPGQLRDRVLEDVERFVGPSPREDDQTVLVLRVP
jgi:hypothetical protein